ncbi:MAG: exodeoxyribonuclease VII small subunit [Verrucomicrobiota bacterium]|nr:exodeoxyribonuclease VII small subunit [Verrucomicrobiota bacterium]
MGKSTDHNHISNPELKFEDAIDKLEQIVTDMEHNKVDLNSMIENYKEGMSLLKFCKKSIDLAELKVSEISGEKSEQPTF